MFEQECKNIYFLNQVPNETSIFLKTDIVHSDVGSPNSCNSTQSSGNGKEDEEYVQER